MTTSQIIACTIASTAAVIAVWALVSLRRTARQIRAERRTLPWRDGVITFSGRMSDADYEAFKARWQATHKPGCAHPVEPIDEEQP